MITNCYIKGRFDYGVGKCAVVIVDDAKPKEEQTIAHQAAWKVPARWDYEGQPVEADQFNCEILAATYALKWCLQNGRKLVNIYANTKTVQKWYFCGEFPDARKVMGKAYLDMMNALQRQIDETEGKEVREVVFAEFIHKKSDNMYNRLVNELAEKPE